MDLLQLEPRRGEQALGELLFWIKARGYRSTGSQFIRKRVRISQGLDQNNVSLTTPNFGPFSVGSDPPRSCGAGAWTPRSWPAGSPVTWAGGWVGGWVGDTLH